jgi:hypothetical protein
LIIFEHLLDISMPLENETIVQLKNIKIPRFLKAP